MVSLPAGSGRESPYFDRGLFYSIRQALEPGDSSASLITIIILLTILLPFIVFGCIWCLIKCSRRSRATTNRGAETASTNTTHTEVEDLDLEVGSESSYGAVQPVRGDLRKMDESTPKKEQTPVKTATMISGKSILPVDQKEYTEEKLKSSLEKVLQKYGHCLREPYKTNTDILPPDDWNDTAPKLTMDILACNMPSGLVRVLLERQNEHLSHLIAQHAKTTTDFEKYILLSPDEQHMTNVKENRIEHMMDVLTHLQEVESSSDEDEYLDASSQWLDNEPQANEEEMSSGQ